ncbi:MAG TPA: aminopeptidase P family protein [Clostridia bacterium]|nr:aminopeptidase P family protein [Clostridia bacterium]
MAEKRSEIKGNGEIEELEPYEGRRHRLKARLKEAAVGAALITSPEDINYLTGFRGDARILLGPDFGAIDVILVDPLNLGAAKEATRGLEVVPIKPGGKGPSEVEVIGNLLTAKGISCLWVEGSGFSASMWKAFSRRLGAVVEVLFLEDSPVKVLRAVKEPGEIDLITKAARITDGVMLEAFTLLRRKATEKETFIGIKKRALELGGEGVAFEPIVASGPRSAMPHAWPSSRTPSSGDFVVLDIGAIYDGYCADLTRTAVIGPPSKKQRALYEVVKAAYEAAASSLRPGVRASLVDASARGVIEEAGYGEFFVHGLGHGVGLAVHELPVLRRPDKEGKEEEARGDRDMILEPGMVVTIEPGIYLPDWGGVRLEDTFVVTQDGARALSDIPRELWVL